MKRMAALLAVMAATAGVAPTAAFAETGDGVRGKLCLLIPLCR